MATKQEIREEQDMLVEIKRLVETLGHLKGEWKDVSYYYFTRPSTKEGCLEGEVFDKKINLTVNIIYNTSKEDFDVVDIEDRDGSKLLLSDGGPTKNLIKSYAYSLVRRTYSSILARKESQLFVEREMLRAIEKVVES